MKPTCSVEGCEREVGARGWCDMHYWRWYHSGSPGTNPDRIQYRGDPLIGIAARIEITDDCWLWTGSLCDGYGSIKNKAATSRFAHRALWERVVGAVPEGLQLDHLCRNRRCVNPDHLEPVTLKENINRGEAAEGRRRRAASITACPQGHDYNDANTYVDKKGCRHCRSCDRERRRARRKAAA